MYVQVVVLPKLGVPVGRVKLTHFSDSVQMEIFYLQRFHRVEKGCEAGRNVRSLSEVMCKKHVPICSSKFFPLVPDNLVELHVISRCNTAIILDGALF